MWTGTAILLSRANYTMRSFLFPSATKVILSSEVRKLEERSTDLRCRSGGNWNDCSVEI